MQLILKGMCAACSTKKHSRLVVGFPILVGEKGNEWELTATIGILVGSFASEEEEEIRINSGE
jgi:hypothetical protein